MSMALPSPRRQSLLARFRTGLIGLRNRMIANEMFQRQVASLPLTRHLAAKRARALFDLCAGFVYSQILLACVRLSLFEILADGPIALADLSERLGLSPDATERLIRAAESLRLLRLMPDGCVALDDLGAALVGNPAVSAFIDHHELLYEDLRDPVALLRGEVRTKLAGFWPYGAGETSQNAELSAFDRYSALMSQTQSLVARDVLDAYSFSRHRCLLDVGGGDGTFLAAVARRYPGLDLILFDLPPVADRARRKLTEIGLDGRIAVRSGSFAHDPLPDGADVVSLVRVVHDHDDPTLSVLFRRIFEALPDGGALLIAEPFAGTHGAEPMGDAYFGFYLLAMGQGRSRRPEEVQRLLKGAGFRRVQQVQTRRPLTIGAMTATKLSI